MTKIDLDCAAKLRLENGPNPVLPKTALPAQLEIIGPR